MSFLPSLPPEAKLLDVFRKYPEPSRLLIELHEPLMRGSSPLSVQQREMIAAFVSALNECSYCHGVHQATAQRFGLEENVITALLAGVPSAPVEEKLKPLLEYVRKLTLTPSRMEQADAQAVFDAGWDEDALFHAVSICALFNCMNRLVEGLGIGAAEEYFPVSAKRLQEGGYVGLIDLIVKKT